MTHDDAPALEPAAGNGILNRRIFLEGAVGAAGVAVAMGATTTAGADPLVVERWMKQPGAGFAGYGQPSRFEDKVVRMIPPSQNPATHGMIHVVGRGMLVRLLQIGIYRLALRRVAAAGLVKRLADHRFGRRRQRRFAGRASRVSSGHLSNYRRTNEKGQAT